MLLRTCVVAWGSTEQRSILGQTHSNPVSFVESQKLFELVVCQSTPCNTCFAEQHTTTKPMVMLEVETLLGQRLVNNIFSTMGCWCAC